MWTRNTSPQTHLPWTPNKLPVIWDAMTLMQRHYNAVQYKTSPPNKHTGIILFQRCFLMFPKEFFLEVHMADPSNELLKQAAVFILDIKLYMDSSSSWQKRCRYRGATWKFLAGSIIAKNLFLASWWLVAETPWVETAEAYFSS